MTAREPLPFDARTRLFLVLASVFATCLVVGDMIGGKLVELPMPMWTAVVTIGMIPFPVTFLLTDLLNEFYGKRAARFVTFVAFGCAVLTYVFLSIGGAVPIAEFTRAKGWTGVTEEAFANVFLGSQRMIIASLSAYIVAQLVDIFVFHSLKRLTSGKLLWLRATGSTVVSQLIDTIVVNVVAWTGILTTPKLIDVIVSSYGVKIVIAIGLTPLIYAGHAAMERWLGIEPIHFAATDAAPSTEPDPEAVRSRS